MVQKLFFIVVVVVVGLAVEDAKNVWHPVVLENNMTIVIVVGKGKESVERLPLFSLSLSSIQKVVFVWLQKDLSFKRPPLRKKKKNDNVKP